MVAIVIILVMIAVPAVIARALRRTRAWWLVGLAILGFGIWALVDAGRTPVHHDDQSYLNGYGVAAEGFLGILATIYGLVLLGLCRHSYRVSHAFDDEF